MPISTAKVGVMTPTYGAPLFARQHCLQYSNQTRKPDVMVYYQNGEFPEYSWTVADVQRDFHIEWIYTDQRVRDETWYSVPIRYLLDQGCDYIFWSDDDDVYFANHVEVTLAALETGNADMVVGRYGGWLETNRRNYRFTPNKDYCEVNGLCGGPSSVAFNRAFAEELLRDLELSIAGETVNIADQIMWWWTMPKFRVERLTDSVTFCYHAHAGTQSSSHVVQDL